MRKLLYLLFALALFASCRKTSDLAQVTGSIKGMGNDTIFLFDDYTLDATLDTIVISNDRFALEFPVDTLKILTVLFGDGTEYPLFIDKKQQLQIKGDTLSLPLLHIDDKGPNALYYSFEKELHAADSLDKEQQLQLVETFIRENNTSIVSVYLIDKYFARQKSPDFRKIKDLISSLSGVMQDQPAVTMISEKLTELDKMTTSRSIPFFSLPNADGTKITRNNDYADKYLVLTFWASWSDTCAANNKALRELQKKYDKFEDLGLIGISLDVDRQAWLDAVKKDSLTWGQVCDLGGFNSTLIGQFGVHTLPTNYLVSPTGVVLLKDVSIDSISNRLQIGRAHV